MKSEIGSKLLKSFPIIGSNKIEVREAPIQSRGADPLDSFPILRSRNIEEVREVLMRSYGARRFDLPHRAEGFEFRANHWQSQNIALSYLSGVPFELEFPSANFFRQAFVRGGAEIRFDRIERQVTSEETCVVPPDVSVAAAFVPGFKHFGLRIKADSLLKKLAALIGVTPSRKLVFDQTTRSNGSAIGNLRRMLTFFAAELDTLGSTCRARASANRVIYLQQSEQLQCLPR